MNTREELNITDLLKSMIAIRSTSCNEQGMTELISSRLSERGIPFIVDSYVPSTYGVVGQDKPTANIYAEVGHGKKTLMLYAHTDIVEGTDTQFQPFIKDDKLFGRGTADMKGSAAGLLHVLMHNYDALSRLAQEKETRLLFTFIADEETNASGIQHFVRWAKERDLGELACVLMEPTEDYSRVHIGGKGYAFLNLEGSMADILASFRSVLSKKPALLAAYADVSDGFGPAVLSLTKITSGLLTPSQLETQVAGKACHASRPYLGINAIERALELYPNSAAIISSQTEGPNSLPSYAGVDILSKRYQDEQTRGYIDMRTNLVASQEDAFLNDVRGLLHPSVKVSLRDYGRAYKIRDTKLAEICTRNMGFEVAEEIAIGGSDAPYLLELTPNIISGFGPGLMSTCHTDTEYVSLSILEQTPRIIMQIIKNYIAK